ncbi:hypothetical protein CEXT_123801 [Caerostris extrusa]|uniref:Uncharacterized protein n=1 Tax=Caerostris extrusa TaxID=172846 RepID=A0AAV4VKE7_CAEEX|nr:hypothetical protein CEXT_123801 [Caerostris extrusa]
MKFNDDEIERWKEEEDEMEVKFASTDQNLTPIRVGPTHEEPETPKCNPFTLHPSYSPEHRNKGITPNLSHQIKTRRNIICGRFCYIHLISVRGLKSERIKTTPRQHGHNLSTVLMPNALKSIQRCPTAINNNSETIKPGRALRVPRQKILSPSHIGIRRNKNSARNWSFNKFYWPPKLVCLE